jgi:predicted secreted protein
MRLSEILGALHFLRGVCNSGEGEKWRTEAKALIDAEAQGLVGRSPMTDFDEPKDPSWLLAFDWVELKPRCVSVRPAVREQMVASFNRGYSAADCGEYRLVARRK